MAAAVPNTVPTPCIEALPKVASVPRSVSRKSLRTSNIWESWASVVPSAKLLISRMLTICNQRVGGSNPSAGSNFPYHQHLPMAQWRLYLPPLYA
jgi:hypothetical protein